MHKATRAEGGRRRRLGGMSPEGPYEDAQRSRDGSQGGVGAPRQLGGMSPEGPYEDAQRSRDGSQGDTAFIPGFINHKAGMAGVDQERVKAVVKELTRGGQHHREESRKDANTEESIAKMKKCMHRSRQLVSARLREASGVASVRWRPNEISRGLGSMSTWMLSSRPAIHWNAQSWRRCRWRWAECP